jgi:hypothetical protein
MPSSQHEALHRIFRDRPELFGTKTAVIIEAQSRADERKTSSWAYYLSYAHIKFECPVVLLVVCQDAATARWARQEKVIGLPGLRCLVVIPIVLGPDNVPQITNPHEAREDAVLTMFSALTHARSPRVDAILKALEVALTTVDTDTAMYIAEQTEIGLGNTKARQIWRSLMTMQNYRFKSEFAEMLRSQGRAEGEARGRAEGEARGRAEGEAKFVLKALEQRKIHVPEPIRERILTCTDLTLLETWFTRSFKVTTAEELFD